ncbi:hypothetical protein MPTK1_4g16430 [Marchantia polymorpha subsp. ruderalis]|uniref:Uncharacterized protein n=2 Tax=Marchantia polymorpha TaxID=3197 RepID=A0AAF6BAI4_MARPO|nr:hypothetical protein MARPO_0054s0108 [Marchantia polymorpha]BBN09018.1 hypothetical protein Mp_4g16430 [Marchantia polymorpha subsp. ruderalis]|eukprot:PTQ38007.1 hypothetical protein MARPO_0054s0108 [Marchantia polymorpha]
MAERPKLLYIILSDDEVAADGKAEKNNCSIRKLPPPRYTRPVLQSTLQLMGCKPRHAFKISDSVFEFLRNEMPVKKAKIRRHHSEAEALSQAYEVIEKQHSDLDTIISDLKEVESFPGNNKTCKPTKKRASVTVNREKFLDVVCDALADYQYVGPNQRADLMLACRVREKKTSVTVLLCGTSGCGKSTLSSLLASRLGITTVVSTDSVRHMMRSFVSEKENPLLWASTYHAGECLDPVAIAEAKAKKKEAKTTSIPHRSSSFEARSGGSSSGSSVAAPDHKNKSPLEEGSPESLSLADGVAYHDGCDAMVGSKTLAVQGFKAQSEMVIDSLDRLITSWEQKNESVVVEGVHLSLNFVMGLMKKHPSIVPFMVYISNEDKHLERFAVRAKYMTLDPAKNKYVKYIRNIRTIQDYLCKRADKHLVPKVNNTNVDKSIALIHATIFSSLRRREGGEPLLDPGTNTVKVVDQEYKHQTAASSLGSKGMFQLIQRRGSSRHLMALMNNDGSVAKAWPIPSDSNGKVASSNGGDSGVGTPVYGPLAIGKAEPVHLQFGNLGLSAWLTDTGAASYAPSYNSSGDGHSSRGELDQNCSRPGSSCSSSPRRSTSPRHGDGAEKELTEDVVVSGSDEEPEEEEQQGADSDGEVSESGRDNNDDDEGSVDDQSIRSDEDAEDYPVSEQQDDVFWSDDLDDGDGKLDLHLPGVGESDDAPTLPGLAGKLYTRARSSPKGRMVRRLSSFPVRAPGDKPPPQVVKDAEKTSHNRSKSFPNWDYSYQVEGK